MTDTSLTFDFLRLPFMNLHTTPAIRLGILLFERAQYFCRLPVADIFACTVDVDEESRLKAFGGVRLARRCDDDGYLMMMRIKLMTEIETDMVYVVAAQGEQCRYM